MESTGSGTTNMCTSPGASPEALYGIENRQEIQKVVFSGVTSCDAWS